MKEIQTIVRRVLSEPGPWVLATLVTVEGSSYRRAGARALFSGNGDRLGSISGGCLEEDILVRVERVRMTQTAEVALYDTTSENDLVWGVGLGCHGVVRVLIEPLIGPREAVWIARVAEALDGGPPCAVRVTWDSTDGRRLGSELAEDEGKLAVGEETGGVFQQRFQAPTGLYVFGAGDDAQPLVQMGAELGWKVTVADPRSALATAARFPAALRVMTGASAERLAEVARPAAGSIVVIMTHHYVHDLPLLRALLPQPLAYVGLLGPRKRAEKMLETLEAEGLKVTAEMRARLFAPVGLDLGAEGADEVALSILAEMQATLAARNARPLRERQGPIHDER